MISFAHALTQGPIQFLMLFASFVHSDTGARLFFFWSLGSILIIFHQNSHVGTIFGTDLRELKSWKNLMIQTPFTPHMISTHYYFPIYLVLCPLLLFLTFPLALALTLVPCLLPFTLSLVLHLALAFVLQISPFSSRAVRGFFSRISGKTTMRT